jgi:hypothetical protein
MPKRKVDQLHGLRIELNQTERDLAEAYIWSNGISKTVQGLGTAVAGLGIPIGIIGGVIIWKEGTKWFQSLLDEDKQKFEDTELTQDKYDAYINQRSQEWAVEASKQGRYAPAIGDVDNYSAWRNLDPARGPVMQPLLFTTWEAANYDHPPLLFDEWANQKKASETRKRRAIVSTIFPPLTLLGIGQYGFKGWFGGTK